MSWNERPWTHDPAHWSAEEVLHLLRWMHAQECSDLVLTAADAAKVRRHGTWVRVTHHKPEHQELMSVLQGLCGDAVGSVLAQGRPQDFSVEVTMPGKQRSLRFRGNAGYSMHRRHGNQVGVEITLRAIPSEVPTLQSVNLEPGWLDIHHRTREQPGVVLVVGATGTGKSTTLAAMLSDILTMEQARRMVTYEAPIEFDLNRVVGLLGTVTQFEVPRHVETFELAVANVLRQAADVVLVGEVRNRETAEGFVQAALTGQLVYATLHASSVAMSLQSLLNRVDASQRRSYASQLMEVLRAVMHQRLVRTVDGHRVAIREWLEFTPKVKAQLWARPLEEWGMVLGAAVRADGQSLLASAEEKFRLGRVSAEVVTSVRYETESGAVEGDRDAG